MAVTRTILPRKGLIQSQHGLTGYEADQDANWQLLDAHVAFLSDLGILQGTDLGINGVVTGFTLSPSSNLSPGLTNGVLYAQGSRYAPVIVPALPPAPASSTSYLFYNAASSFYYQTGAVGASPGDALVAVIVTSSTSVTSAIPATKIYGQISISSNASGNFTIAHLLGRVPLSVSIQMTSAGSIWFQPGVLYDETNVYLTASGAAVTAKLQVW